MEILSKQITVDVRGEILQLKETINTMVEQLALVCLRSDARGARGGTEGRLGGQAAGAGRGWNVEGSDGQRELRWAPI
jgi:hypothetical protein